MPYHIDIVLTSRMAITVMVIFETGYADVGDDDDENPFEW